MKAALIDIDLANTLKRHFEDDGSSNIDLAFRCPQCEQPVAAHKSGQGKQGPHFEHIAGNVDNCTPRMRPRNET